jgi:hypothetical protein
MMIASLARQAADAVVAGDMEAARIAHAAMGALLASEGPPVVLRGRQR